MRVYLKTILVFGLLALLVPVLLGYVGVSGAVYDPGNMTRSHMLSKNIDNDECADSACHDRTKLYEGTGGGLNGHKTHGMAYWLRFDDPTGIDPWYGCSRCHRQTRSDTKNYEGDISTFNEDGAALNPVDAQATARKQVDSSVCRTCHGSFVTGSAEGGEVVHVTWASVTASAQTWDDHDGNDFSVLNPTGCTDFCHDSDGPGSDAKLGTDIVHAGGTTSPNDSPIGDLYWVKQYTLDKNSCTKCHGALVWFDVNETNPAP